MTDAERERKRVLMRAINNDASFRTRSLMRLVASLSNPRANAIRKAAVRASNQRRAGLRVIEVPHWVPDGLSCDYIDFGRDFGEIEAARRVRRLKEEA